MRFSYFHDTDTLHLDLLRGPCAEGFDVTDSIIAGAKSDGRISYLTIDHASEQFKMDDLATRVPRLRWIVKRRGISDLELPAMGGHNGSVSTSSSEIRFVYYWDQDRLCVEFTDGPVADTIKPGASVYVGVDGDGNLAELVIGFVSDKVDDFNPSASQPGIEWSIYQPAPVGVGE